MTATLNVSDFLSNVNDQLVNSAKLMQRSLPRQRVFEAIYKGQKQEKSIKTIMEITGLTQTRVLDEGKKLGPLVEKVKKGYKKRKELAPYYKKILTLARNKINMDRVPTKIAPKVNSGGMHVKLVVPSSGKATQITIDDFETFANSPGAAKTLGATSEKKIKKAFVRLAGEGGVFTDWGGEKSDLYSNKFRVCGKRRAVAIAFKGKGTKGKLVPKKMGANGDQIGRLFDEPAEVFLVVFCGQIDSSIVSQMHAFAIAKKAAHGQRVYFGVIDADDLGRIAAGYPEAFK